MVLITTWKVRRWGRYRISIYLLLHVHIDMYNVFHKHNWWLIQNIYINQNKLYKENARPLFQKGRNTHTIIKIYGLSKLIFVWKCLRQQTNCDIGNHANIPHVNQLSGFASLGTPPPRLLGSPPHGHPCTICQRVWPVGYADTLTIYVVHADKRTQHAGPQTGIVPGVPK